MAQPCASHSWMGAASSKTPVAHPATAFKFGRRFLVSIMHLDERMNPPTRKLVPEKPQPGAAGRRKVLARPPLASLVKRCDERNGHRTILFNSAEFCQATKSSTAAAYQTTSRVS